MKFDTQLERHLKSLGKTLALGDPNRYNQDMIFIPESSKEITAAYCDEYNYYTAYGVMVATLRNNKLPLLYICAVLNSKLITYYAIQKEILRKGNKATPHVGVKGVYSLPIVLCPHELMNFILELVRYITSCRKKGNEDFTDQMNQIDIIIYHLYRLTYEEVLVVDPHTPITLEEYEKAEIQ